MKVLEVNRAMLGIQNQCRQLIDLLPDIKGVGFDALYLLPVLEKGKLRAIGSPYCIRDFWKLDPDFGTDEDWDDLQKACVHHQLELWIDWVMNHTAWDHSWMTQHPEWYVRDVNNQACVHPLGTDWTDVAQLNFSNDCISYFAHLAGEWISKRGVRGFRCDAAYRIPLRTWAFFFHQLGTEKNQAIWLSDKHFSHFNEFGFEGFFSDGPLFRDSLVWNKVYDHDRSSFGPYWNSDDDARCMTMLGDKDKKMNWLMGMGMVSRNQQISFFENQEFDQAKWSLWITQLSVFS